MWAGVAVAVPTEAKFETAADTAANESDVRDEVSSRSAPPPPLGVRFGEPLKDRRFRVAYRFERLRRKGLLVGDSHVSPSRVLNRPPNFHDRTPRSLEVTVHAVQLAYAPHPRTTLIVEVPFVLKELETVDEFGRRTQEQTQGVGDIVLALVVPFIRRGGRVPMSISASIYRPEAFGGAGAIHLYPLIRRSETEHSISNGVGPIGENWTGSHGEHRRSVDIQSEEMV